jgi:hypothetical protein
MTLDIFPTLHFLPRPGLTPGALSFSRSGTATRVDPRGRVETVAADLLRHDFDPLTGAYLGWRVEEGRTNLLIRCRDASVAPWTRTGLTATLDAEGLDGEAATATALTAGQAGATLYQSLTAASAAYTLSVDLKRLSGGGTVSLTLDGGATWSEVTGQVVEDRYSRVSVTQTVANPVAGLRLATAGDAVAADFWQVEAGSFATSRIPTTTAPVARGPDLLSLDTTADWFNPVEGTVYIEASIAAASTAVKNLFSTLDAPDAVECSVNDPAEGVHVNSGAIASGWTGSSPSGQAVAVGQPLRFALTHGPRGGAFVHDGTAFQTFSTGKGWDTSQMAIGCQLRNGAQRFLNGHLRHFAVFPRCLSETQAVELTTL